MVASRRFSGRRLTGPPPSRGGGSTRRSGTEKSRLTCAASPSRAPVHKYSLPLRRAERCRWGLSPHENNGRDERGVGNKRQLPLLTSVRTQRADWIRGTENPMLYAKLALASAVMAALYAPAMAQVNPTVDCTNPNQTLSGNCKSSTGTEQPTRGTNTTTGSGTSTTGGTATGTNTGTGTGTTSGTTAGTGTGTGTTIAARQEASAP